MSGFYGKLPSKGDFVMRGLRHETSDIIHSWLEKGLKESRNELKEKWMEAYSIGPIWHFYLAPGVISENPVLGLWMPSVDRVNRNFPLAVISEISSNIGDLSDIHLYDDWFKSCEDLCLDCFDGVISFEDFCASLSQLSPLKREKNSPDVDKIFSEAINSDSSKGELTNKGRALVPDIDEASPFEKALLAKVDMLESVIKQLCSSANLDYAKLVDQYIEENVRIDAESNKQLITPTEIVSDCNMIDLVSKDSFKYALGDSECIWVSSGNNQMREQIVITNGLVSSESFLNFFTSFDRYE